ncbi:MAG: carboxymuconolactone decarboxylase family protein [Anaerolineae bacterium]
MGKRVSEERVAQAHLYIEERMLFLPRMFEILNAFNPAVGERYADFYQVAKRDGALSRKIKELIFTAIGVTTRSPRCLVHIIPAIEAGARDAEIFEAMMVGVIAAGFVPRGLGIPYAIEYAMKVLAIADKYRQGADWEYLLSPRFRA